jgi:hypothetical protein
MTMTDVWHPARHAETCAERFVLPFVRSTGESKHPYPR